MMPSSLLILPAGADPSPFDGLALGGDPDINSSVPTHMAALGVPYFHRATASDADNGSLIWQLFTNALWLTAFDGGNGSGYCNVSGIPDSTGTFWANLTVRDSDSYDYQNWTVMVVEPGRWGFVETLASYPTGTHGPSILPREAGSLTLLQSSGLESVVLDGKLFIHGISDQAMTTAATYSPTIAMDGLGWNISAELYPTRERSSYVAFNKTPPTLGLHVFIEDGGAQLAGAAFYAGDSPFTGERIRLYNATSSTWSDVATDVIPSYPSRSDPHPENPAISGEIFGGSPERYRISFRHESGSDLCLVTIAHTSTGAIASAELQMPTAMSTTPLLRFVADIDIPPTNQWGYWIVDNLAARGLLARSVSAGPAYEYIVKGQPAWLNVTDERGALISDASVFIDGFGAAFNSLSGRYEVHGIETVDWNVPVSYAASVDGVMLLDVLLLSVMPNLADQDASLPLWWNGWDWVTVFGRDDSWSATTASITYMDYNHPSTSYVMSSIPSGSSSDLLATQSEIALHFPHDYNFWPQRFWDDAVLASEGGHDVLENAFAFASRWDDPSYVGSGDMYITIANPGNSGSLQMAFAEYARGTRIMGFTSNPYNGAPGNASLMGSWWYPVFRSGESWNAPTTGWYPYTPFDLLDAGRLPSTDNNMTTDDWESTFWMAEHGGVRRVYNHGTITPSAMVLLDWMDASKTNFSYENWKATDGEVASYVYGRWSTDIVLDEGLSNDSVFTYQVSRRDPIDTGFWRVPVTIAFDLHNRTLVDINITEGNMSLSIGRGTLRDLQGKRIMDVGFDIRNETVYVSYFWNESSTVTFVFTEEVVVPNVPPTASFSPSLALGNISTMFTFDASSSYDSEDALTDLMFRWDFDGDGTWDTDWSSGYAGQYQYYAPGNFTVVLEVMDSGGLVGVAYGTVEVSAVEVPEFERIMLPLAGVFLTFLMAARILRTRKRVP